MNFPHEYAVPYLLQSTNLVVLKVLLVLAFVYLVSGLDDLFIDLAALLGRVGPRRLDERELTALHTHPERPIAIIVPAWKEGNIIDRMLFGNLGRIEYRNYHFFVGVYPNDPLTVQQVQKVAKMRPNVHAIVNAKDGPTSKGQILNHVIHEIFAFEEKSGIRFDGFLMQDAEDLIHPLALKLVNVELDHYAFIQIPVFSLEVKGRELIAGTYIDEFAENHTKDILVREKLGAAIPSAGVGTGLSRGLVVDLLRQRAGLFNEGTLTEDYELGNRAHQLGYRSHVACCHYPHPDSGKPEYIATREYFPKKFNRSVRQKTRWTVGIALQGWRNLGWQGRLANVYFLARDRKGLVTNIATFLGYPCMLWSAAYAARLDATPVHHVFSGPMVHGILYANVGLMGLRVFQRMRCVSRIYGIRAALPVALRWPIANTINALAACHALKNDLMARFTKATVAWVKTEHELPHSFGQLKSELEVAN